MCFELTRETPSIAFSYWSAVYAFLYVGLGIVEFAAWSVGVVVDALLVGNLKAAYDWNSAFASHGSLVIWVDIAVTYTVCARALIAQVRAVRKGTKFPFSMAYSFGTPCSFAALYGCIVLFSIVGVLRATGCDAALLTTWLVAHLHVSFAHAVFVAAPKCARAKDLGRPASGSAEA